MTASAPRRWPPLYPFILASYPTIALTVENLDSIRRPVEPIAALALVWSLTGLVWIGLRRPFPDRDRRALATLIVMGLFAWYGVILDVVRPIATLGSLRHHTVAFPAALVGTALLVWCVRTHPRRPSGAARFLGVTALLLLAFPLWSLAHQAGERARSQSLRPKWVDGQIPEIKGTPARPDIYLIVLDAYTGSQSLKDYYGFDNSDFEAKLRARGFAVPRAARANYVGTFLSLASILNWMHLDRVAKVLGPGSTDHGALNRLIEDNRTWRLLQGLGYRFVFVGTSYGPTAGNRLADIVIRVEGGHWNPYVSEWIRTTAIQPLADLACRVIDCALLLLTRVPESAEAIELKIARLSELPDSAGPLFVFAHLIVPHDPFVFDERCGHRRPFWSAMRQGAAGAPFRAAYVAQVRCVNRLMERLIDRVLGPGRRPAVVLLQADHGQDLLDWPAPALERVDPGSVRARADVFAAYFVPGMPDGLFPDSMTVVNLFPIVFNYLFGTKIPLLEDVTYWSDWRRPYRLIRVLPEPASGQLKE